MFRFIKKIISVLVLGASAFTLFSCTSGKINSVSQDKEILVVSFGTSYNESRELTIGAIENSIRKSFPDYKVERAFTSEIIIKKIRNRDGIVIDSVKEAMDRAVENGIKTLVVQPTHLMDGLEYNDIVNEVREYESKIEKIVIAAPLLSGDDDFVSVAKAVAGRTERFVDGKTAVCFMGHGTEAASNGVYSKMQDVFIGLGCEDYYVGTVEASPTLDDVMKKISATGKYSRVVLEPLMVVSGDHANNDMAGDEDDSWKSILEAEGYKVECILEGLGQNADVQKIYVAHTKAAIDSISK